ncbi:MAG TPA: hypothetical protein DCR95_09260 [Desulfobacter sp.]|nr:hypothetical protein [Desulfobacter sp.]
MNDIAIGRKEIMQALRVTSWITIRRWKKYHKLPIRYLPNQKPMIIVSEIKEWLKEYPKR